MARGLLLPSTLLLPTFRTGSLHIPKGFHQLAQGCESDELPWVDECIGSTNPERVASPRDSEAFSRACLSHYPRFSFTSFSPQRIDAPSCVTPSYRVEMHRYLGGILNGLECQPLVIGGVEDHVHALTLLSRTCTVADLVKEMKRSSSLWIKQRAAVVSDFGWQNGYGVFSAGFSQVNELRRYIGSQEEHHRKMSFQDEFRRLLERYQVAFDERYVWD